MFRQSIRLTKLRVGLLIFVVLIVLIRVLAPAIILKKLNEGLANTSPVYSMHIGDLDIGFFTLSYVFTDIQSKYKKTGETFFKMDRVRVEISFRELLRLRILTNVRADNGHFILTKALFQGSKDNKEESKKATKQTANALFPIRISLVEIHNSDFDFSDFVPKDRTTRWRVSGIEAKAFNINPLPENPYTSFDVNGNLLNSFPFKVIGKAKRLDKPIGWKLDAEVKDFTLTTANPFLLEVLPFTFKAGTLDLYSELKSENGQYSGYVKPFLKNVAILKADQHYKSIKHFFFELAGAFANFMLKNADNKITATKIAFHTEDGHFKVDTGDAIKEAIKNGYTKPLTPGIDDTVPFK